MSVQMPVNSFKRALLSGVPQIGLWMGMTDPCAGELLAGAGFDWLLIDTEHSPNDLRTVLAQLQAVAPYPVHPVVRPVHGAAELIKQYLDVGVQTLLVPMVETSEQAARAVAATRYRRAESEALRAQRRVHRGGVKSTVTSSAAKWKYACWFRWSPSGDWRICERSPRSKV